MKTQRLLFVPLAVAVIAACQHPLPKLEAQAQTLGPRAPAAAADEPAGSPSGWTLRTPDQVRADGNHLKGQGSVYLGQHAHNPLEWYPWGKEALSRSRDEDKPIFLSIGYASCHWCHVMEHEVFEHDDVAAFMNEHFINIKVDREERPDLDTIYMDAVQSLTGRGGWPMTVLLTPSLKPFFGGTYFPKRRFMPIVRDALKRFREDRNGVESEGDSVYAKIAKTAAPERGRGLTTRALKGVVDRAKRSFDEDWGGLRGRMKFPTPVRWRYLLHAWRKWGDEDLAIGIRRTLDKMADGGIHDQLGGGFHRYTVEKTWLVPHFEKMLYDNSQLASLFLEAAAGFGEPRYLEVATTTLDYMLKEMASSDGGFYASYDADSGGEEGTFYVWTPKELTEICGPEDGPLLSLLLGVSARGNFEHGTSILTRRISFDEVGKRQGVTGDRVRQAWARWQPRLYDIRSKRVWPGLDKKLVTSWNGLAIGAMAKGYAATGDTRYKTAAVRTAQLMMSVHRQKDGTLYRVSNGGVPKELGILDDYAFLAGGLLDLFEATGDLRWLGHAQELVAQADRRFKRPEGGWFMAEETDTSLVLRPFDTYDAVRPCGQSSLLDAHLRLAALKGDPKGFATVEAALSGYGRLAGQSGLGMAGWLNVGLRLAGPLYEVVIAGNTGDGRAEALRAVYKKLSPPWAVRVDVPQSGPNKALEKALPPSFAKRGKDGGPLAYVCVRGSCKAPTSNIDVFRKQLTDGWAH